MADLIATSAQWVQSEQVLTHRRSGPKKPVPSKAGDIYDDSFIQQFRKENGTKTLRLTLEPAIDAARKVIDVKIVAAARQ